MANKLTIAALILLSMAGWFAPPKSAHAQDEVTWLHNQINALRANLGLRGYNLNPALMSAAQAHGNWMAETNIISHEGVNGSSPGDRARASGYDGRLVSENIYGGPNATASSAWNWWLNSPIHYSGIAHPDKTDVGIGIGTDGRWRYYVLVFGYGGSGGSAPPPPPQEEAPPPENSAPEAIVEQPSAPEPTQPPPPTRIIPTWTPSPTIPSATPTITWTPTATWTPSATPTVPPPSATPLILPTAAEITPTAEPIEIALQPLATQTVAQLDDVTVTPTDEDTGFDWRLLLPLLIVGQVGLVSWIAWRFTRRLV